MYTKKKTNITSCGTEKLSLEAFQTKKVLLLVSRVAPALDCRVKNRDRAYNYQGIANPTKQPRKDINMHEDSLKD